MDNWALIVLLAVMAGMQSGADQKHVRRLKRKQRANIEIHWPIPVTLFSNVQTQINFLQPCMEGRKKKVLLK